ncbi:MAG: hypothetical protein HC811_01085 [Flammeovirgaceae bacterium]|nr:hypothetical protein [Flammeovirgaceae bacterium]
MILEKATGTSPAIFFNEFLWLKIQPEYEATWSVDSEEHQMVKMESGINCRAIDFAKFGRLLLNDGTWGDETILSQNRMAKYLNLDRNQASEYVKNIYYQQGWWLHVDENDSVKAVAAWGHLGQYLYIFPEKNLIIARFGKKTGKDIRWPSFFMSLSERL